jgi:hypothetical protein
LPLAVHPKIESALIVGYGIGNTAAALCRAPEVAHIDVADISTEMLTMSRSTDRGRHPLDDPRLTVHVEDGRQFLQATGRRYDLITGEPPPPIMAGVVNLYTREYFQLVRSRLTDGGIATHWLPIINITSGTAKSIISGFCEAFDDCSLWHGSGKNFVLMGTRGARGPVSEARFRRQWEDPETREELVSIGIEDPSQLGALFIGDAGYLHGLVEGAPPLTDDRPKRMQVHRSSDSLRPLLRRLQDVDTARERFRESALVAKLLPPPIRKNGLMRFEFQGLIDAFLFGDAVPSPSKLLHHLLFDTPLRFPVLLLLHSDPDVQRALAAAPAAERGRPEFAKDRAAGFLSERKFPAALRALEQIPDPGEGDRNLRRYVEYVLRRTPRTSH